MNGPNLKTVKQNTMAIEEQIEAIRSTVNSARTFLGYNDTARADMELKLALNMLSSLQGTQRHKFTIK